MGIAMIVKKAFRPRGSGSPLLEPGSPFEALGESEARSFRALGFAEDAPKEETAPPPKPVRTYTKKVVETEAEVPAVKTSRRSYLRRDLTADKDE